jgi:membrane protein YdbS with pleckstrin-like domain
MTDDQVILRKSPFLFLKWIVLVEFLFALLPFALAAITNLQAAYEGTATSRIVSYPLLVTLVMTTLQVLILAIAFVAWYFPAYHIDGRQVVFKRGRLFEDQKLADTPLITKVERHQGPLGRRLDYGTLVLHRAEGQDPASIRDIPNPGRYAEMLETLASSSPLPRDLPPAPPIHELIAGGENQFVEFKSSLVWDYRRQMANKDLYEPVMKNLVAFMNSSGGRLVIGVDDEGRVLGLQKDWDTLPKKNADGWENAFTMAFNKMIGVEYREFVDVGMPEADGETICLVTVRPASRPAYLTFKGQETFYIRAGNSSQPLTVSKATQYIQSHFGA